MKRCKRCLLPEVYPNISFNNKGVCSYCLGKSHFGVEKDKKILNNIKNKEKLKKEFEEFIKKTKGKSDYDCLLLLSGGKDSIYLLYLLKEKYGLNILALSVDTGLIQPLAKKNIKQTVEKLKIDHISVTPGNDFFKKLYKYYLFNGSEVSYSERICPNCSKVIHSIGLIEASKRQIPCVVIANSPDQTDHYFFEIPNEKISQSWIPKDLEYNYFNKIDLKFFWNPKKEDYLPRFFIPFHVINYPGEKAIIKKISKSGFINKKKLNPIKTNCSLVWLLDYLDLNKIGYMPYVKDLSRKIQSERIHISKIEKIFYLIGIKLLKLKILKRRDIKFAMKYLDLNFGEEINRESTLHYLNNENLFRSLRLHCKQKRRKFN